MAIFKKKAKSASQASLDKAAHIKPNTIGTSNEISLSVLDAAREKTAEQLKAEDAAAVAAAAAAAAASVEGSVSVVGGLDAAGEGAGVAREIGDSSASAASVSTASASAANVSGSSTASEHSAIAATASTAATSAAHSAINLTGTDAGNMAANSSFSQNLNESFASEVAKKKAKRRKSKATAIVITCIILAAVVAVLALAFRAYTLRVEDFNASFDAAIEQLSSTDETLSQLNEILEKPTSTDSRRSLAGMLRAIQESETSLDECEAAVEHVKEKAMLPTENEKSYQLRNSLDARRDMLDVGEQIVAQLKPAIESIDALEASKAKVDSAASLEQKAANLITDPTTDNLNDAKAAVEDAINEIEHATTSLDTAEKACSDADLNNYAQYLQYKKDALSNQSQAIQAIIDEDTARARECQTSYENADAQAKTLAAAITHVTDPVLDVYKKKTADLSQDYETARSNAAAADEYLRANM